MAEIQELLRAHRFEELFIEGLGWDHAAGVIEIDLDGQHFDFRVIAQKEGVAVLECNVHRAVLAHRGLLRKLQRQLNRSYHEHIVVYTCEEPRKQVWQWAVYLSDSRKIRHCERPFFSNDPPAPFLERLAKLEFSLEDEETAKISNAVGRVRMALDTLPEKKLFARRSGLAKRSNELAVAMRQGVPGAFDDFVLLHRPLARKASQMLVRWVGMDEEDAEQIAMIGLMEAARRFEPERCAYFSTYARYWIHQQCQTYGVDIGLPIRLPTNRFWSCYKLRFEHERLLATWGSHEARGHFEDLLEEKSVPLALWNVFQHAFGFVNFSDLNRDEWQEIRSIPDSCFDPGDEASLRELKAKMLFGLSFLNERRATVLMLRYGIGTREHTLEEVGNILGVTRERARQIQEQAEQELQAVLLLGAPRTRLKEVSKHHLEKPLPEETNLVWDASTILEQLSLDF